MYNKPYTQTLIGTKEICLWLCVLFSLDSFFLNFVSVLSGGQHFNNPKEKSAPKEKSKLNFFFSWSFIFVFFLSRDHCYFSLFGIHKRKIHTNRNRNEFVRLLIVCVCVCQFYYTSEIICFASARDHISTRFVEISYCAAWPFHFLFLSSEPHICIMTTTFPEINFRMSCALHAQLLNNKNLTEITVHGGALWGWILNSQLKINGFTVFIRTLWPKIPRNSLFNLAALQNGIRFHWMVYMHYRLFFHFIHPHLFDLSLGEIQSTISRAKNSIECSV